jgi:hypothetical protein
LHAAGDTDRQTDRQTDRETDRQTDRQTGRHDEADGCFLQFFANPSNKKVRQAMNKVLNLQQRQPIA